MISWNKICTADSSLIHFHHNPILFPFIACHDWGGEYIKRQERQKGKHFPLPLQAPQIDNGSLWTYTNSLGGAIQGDEVSMWAGSEGDSM